MHPTLTIQQVKDRAALQRAIAEALSGGASNKSALNAVLRSIRTGTRPTARQLKIVNDARSRLGMPRVSVPVHDRERDRRRWTHRQQTINSEFAALAASRPLTPPGRR